MNRLNFSRTGEILLLASASLLGQATPTAPAPKAPNATKAATPSRERMILEFCAILRVAPNPLAFQTIEA